MSRHTQPLKSRDSKPLELSTKGKAIKKVMHTKQSDVAPRLRKSEDGALKHTEPVQPLMESYRSSQKTNVQDRSGTEVKKLLQMPLVQQKKKVVSLMDLNLTGRYRQPVSEFPRAGKLIPEPASQKEMLEVNQKDVVNNSEQKSHPKVKTDKAVVASKKEDKIAPETLLAVTPDVHEKENVVQPMGVLSSPASPVQVVAESVTTDVGQQVANEEPEVLPPADVDECSDVNSRPEFVQQPEQTVSSQLLLAGKKAEVSTTKNVAQVKPLLVANVPEKSKWERDTDVSDSRDSPMQIPRDRDKPTTAATTKTALPRYVCIARCHRFSVKFLNSVERLARRCAKHTQSFIT